MTAVNGRQIADGIFQLPSDYPEVMDAPLWIYAIRNGTVAVIDSAIPSTYDAILGAGLREVGIGPATIGLGGPDPWPSGPPGRLVHPAGGERSEDRGTIR